MDILCTFKIKIESQNLQHDCTKDHLLYPNQDQDAKPQSGIFLVAGTGWPREVVGTPTTPMVTCDQEPQSPVMALLHQPAPLVGSDEWFP